jgi:hypothetical protein
LVKDCRSSKSLDALRLLITTAQQKLDNTDHQRLFIAILQLFKSAVEQSALLSPDIAAQLASLSQSILSTFTSHLRSLGPTAFVSVQADTLRRVEILSAVTRYRAQASLTVDGRDLANTLCVQALKSWNQSTDFARGVAPQAEGARVLLNWVIAQSEPSTSIEDMKSFFAMWSAFTALIGEYACPAGEMQYLTLSFAQLSKGQSNVLETLLRDVFASASGPVFESLLTLLASTLEREVEDSKGLLVPALRALAVVSALSIQRKYNLSSFRYPSLYLSMHPRTDTGRIYRSILARLLSGLRRLVQRSQNVQVHLACLRLVEVIASEKVSAAIHDSIRTL